MKAVFLKEWRQAYLILWLGLVLAAFIPVLYLILVLTHDPTWTQRRDMNGLVGWFFFLYPFGVAVVAGANAFAPEIERGTLPLLLSLPLSRRRIWLAKLLATFTIGLTTFSLTFIPNYLILRPAFEEVHYSLYAPDRAIWSFITFLCAFLLSTLLRRTVSAILGGLVLTAGLFAIIGLAMVLLGAMLVGYCPLLDTSLWALILSPGLLAASYLAFTRGGLLTSGRKWMLASIGFVVTALITGLPTIGVTRWLVRYDRDRVAMAWTAEISADGSVAVVVAQGGPVPLERKDKWVGTEGVADYRSTHTVCVDTTTGRELVVLPVSAGAVLSPDGGRALLAFGARPLTWIDSPGHARSIELWDLRPPRLLYRSHLWTFWRQARPPIGEVVWSPSGEWLALPDPRHDLASGVEGEADAPQVAVVRVEETGVPTSSHAEGMVLSDAYCWGRGPNGNAFYALRRGCRLVRHDLETGREKLIWDGAAQGYLPEDRHVPHAVLRPSPDGKWIALNLSTYATYSDDQAARGAARDSGPRLLTFLLLIAADGSSWRPLQDGALEDGGGLWPEDRGGVSITWAADGHTLYVLGHRSGASGVNSIAVWQTDEERAVVTHLPEEFQRGGLRSDCLHPLPDSDRVLLVWRDAAGYIRADGTYEALPESVARMLTHRATVLGFDPRGRLLLNKWGEDVDGKSGEPFHLAACDLRTGRVERIYP